MKNSFIKSLSVSLGLHCVIISFFIFNSHELQKSETSITEVTILTTEESKLNKKKNDFKEEVKKDLTENKKSIGEKIKNNINLKEKSYTDIKKKNNNNFKIEKYSKTLQEEKKSNNSSKKAIQGSEQEKAQNFFKNKNYSQKNKNKNLIHSSASYKLGSENNPHPIYPLLARKKGLEGRVIIQVNVDKLGNVFYIKILESSGHKVLDEISLKTLKKWKFTPAQIGNKYVNDTVNIPVKFLLTN